MEEHIVNQSLIHYPIYIGCNPKKKPTREILYWFLQFFRKKKNRMVNIAITHPTCGCYIEYSQMPENTRKCIHGNTFVKYMD